MIGAESPAALLDRLTAVLKAAQAGSAPAPAPPAESDLRAAERLVIDYADASRAGDQVRSRAEGV